MRSVAGQSHDWRLRLQAKRQLRYPAVQFNGSVSAMPIPSLGEVLLFRGMADTLLYVRRHRMFRALGKLFRKEEPPKEPFGLGVLPHQLDRL